MPAQDHPLNAPGTWWYRETLPMAPAPKSDDERIPVLWRRTDGVPGHPESLTSYYECRVPASSMPSTGSLAVYIDRNVANGLDARHKWRELCAPGVCDLPRDYLLGLAFFDELQVFTPDDGMDFCRITFHLPGSLPGEWTCRIHENGIVIEPSLEERLHYLWFDARVEPADELLPTTAVACLSLSCEEREVYPVSFFWVPPGEEDGISRGRAWARHLWDAGSRQKIRKFGSSLEVGCLNMLRELVAAGGAPPWLRHRRFEIFLHD